MKKVYKEYFDKYGQVDSSFIKRILTIMNDLKIGNKEYDKLRNVLPKLINKKWNKIDFVFFMIPKPTSRPRSTSIHKFFYVKNASDNNAIFREFVKECEDLDFTITTPVKFYLDIFMPMPSSMNKIEKICAELKLLYHVSRPDWDNLGKTYSDMIQGYFLLDDSLIIDGRTRKFYSFKPRIEIHMEFMEFYDCKYNKKKIEAWSSYQELKNRIYEKDSII